MWTNLATPGCVDFVELIKMNDLTVLSVLLDGLHLINSPEYSQMENFLFII